MSTVTLSIGPKSYTVACADGQEAHIRALGALIAEKYAQLGSTRAPLEAQNLVFAALFLADELDQAKKQIAAIPEPDTTELDALRAAVSRLEAELAATREAAATARQEAETAKAEAAEAKDAAAVTAARAAAPAPLAGLAPQYDLFGGPPLAAPDAGELAARLEALAARAEASAAALEAAAAST